MCIRDRYCALRENFVVWNNPNNSCADDVLQYQVYFTPAGSDLPILIATISNPADTSYLHIPSQTTIGCYTVVALDSVGNTSTGQIAACVDSCVEYNLPNIFTPDGDGINDLFHPCDL